MLMERATPIWACATGRASSGSIMQAAASRWQILKRRDMVISPCIGARKRQYLPVCPDDPGVCIETQNRGVCCKLKSRYQRSVSTMAIFHQWGHVSVARRDFRPVADGQVAR